MIDVQSDIIALFVQSVMYGLYVASAGHALRWLLCDDQGWRFRQVLDKPRFFMLVTAVLLFLLSTADLVTSLILTIKSDSKTKSFYDINTVNIVAENGTALIADGVLIYLCWIVYAKSWRVAFLPTILWNTNLAFSIMIIVYEAKHSAKHQGGIFLHLWVLFYTCTLAINIYSTSAAIYRLLRVAEESCGRTPGRLYRACRNLAESGFLYALTSILILVTSVIYIGSDSSPAYKLADALHFSMTGITFNLILIRSHQRPLPGDEHADSKNGTGDHEQLPTMEFRMDANEASHEPSPSVDSSVLNHEEIQEVERSASIHGDHDFDMAYSGI